MAKLSVGISLLLRFSTSSVFATSYLLLLSILSSSKRKRNFLHWLRFTGVKKSWPINTVVLQVKIVEVLTNKKKYSLVDLWLVYACKNLCLLKTIGDTYSAYAVSPTNFNKSNPFIFAPFKNKATQDWYKHKSQHNGQIDSNSRHKKWGKRRIERLALQTFVSLLAVITHRLNYFLIIACNRILLKIPQLNY